MKKFIKNLFFSYLIATLLLEINPNTISAMTTRETDRYNFIVSYDSRKEEIGYVYRVVDGVMQCRL